MIQRPTRPVKRTAPASPPLTGSNVRQPCEDEGKELIVGIHHGMLTSGLGLSKQSGLGPPEDPRPSALLVGREGSRVRELRRVRSRFVVVEMPAPFEGRRCPAAVRGLRRGCSRCFHRGPGSPAGGRAALLREPGVPFGRALQRGCIAVLKRASNPPVERTACAAAHRQQRYALAV